MTHHFIISWPTFMGPSQQSKQDKQNLFSEPRKKTDNLLNSDQHRGKENGRQDYLFVCNYIMIQASHINNINIYLNETYSGCQITWYSGFPSPQPFLRQPPLGCARLKFFCFKMNLPCELEREQVHVNFFSSESTALPLISNGEK